MAGGGPPRLLAFPGLAAAGLPHAVTTRLAPPVGRPGADRSPFDDAAWDALAPVGLPFGRAAWVHQVHGVGVARVASPGRAGAADILLTRQPALPLAVFTADCVPLVLWSEAVGALALAHVGWRGLVRGAVEAALEALAVAGASPGELRVAVGPCIGACCYEVDAPVTDALGARYGERAGAWLARVRPGHAMLDLGQASADILAAAGVPRAGIEALALCTACRGDLLFSHRRGDPGRLATVAALPAREVAGLTDGG